MDAGPAPSATEAVDGAADETDPRRYRILVPVGESPTLRSTVAHAVALAREGQEAGHDATVHFVFPVPWERRGVVGGVGEEAEELLERVVTWAHEDLGLAEDEEVEEHGVDLEASVIGEERFLFSPVDYAEVLVEHARAQDLGRIILDPDYQPGARAPLLTPLKAELEIVEGLDYEVAPIQRPIRRRTRIMRRTAGSKDFWATFGFSFLFYLGIGGFSGMYDLVTGAISAIIVATLLSRVAFEETPTIRGSSLVFIRWLIYLPFLLWEITKANLQVAYVVLHPRLPIDPDIVRFQPAVWHGLPVTTLANSITLTPGTLTVDVREGDFYVHHLTTAAREGLLAGTLERAVRFVFYGRASARIPAPRERSDGGEDGP